MGLCLCQWLLAAFKVLTRPTSTTSHALTPTLTSGCRHGQRINSLCPTLELAWVSPAPETLSLLYWTLPSLLLDLWGWQALPASAKSWASSMQHPVLTGFIRLWAHQGQEARLTPPGIPSLWHLAQPMHDTKEELRPWGSKAWMPFSPGLNLIAGPSWLPCFSVARRGIWHCKSISESLTLKFKYQDAVSLEKSETHWARWLNFLSQKLQRLSSPFRCPYCSANLVTWWVSSVIRCLWRIIFKSHQAMKAVAWDQAGIYTKLIFFSHLLTLGCLLDRTFRPLLSLTAPYFK